MKIKLVALIAAGLFAVLVTSAALAVPSGRVLEWKTSTGSSTIVFDGKAHAKAGLKYGDCHPKIFVMKKGYAVMKMIDIINGKYCGECHNGERAFSSEKPEFCAKCHKKM